MKRNKKVMVRRAESAPEQFGEQIRRRPWANAARLTKSLRRGTSLIHMLVVITSLGFLTTTVITTMVTMMRSQGRAAGVWVVHHQWLKLTDHWRRDALAALSAEITQQDNASAFVFRSNDASHRRSQTDFAPRVSQVRIRLHLAPLRSIDSGGRRTREPFAAKQITAPERAQQRTAR